jgi:hypothetical protein
MLNVGIIVTLAVLVLVAPALADAPSATERGECAGVAPELGLHRRDVEAIRAAVRRRTRFKVIRVRPAGNSAEAGAVEAVTLTTGDCFSGEGNRFVLQRSSRGWRVTKKSGRYAWLTAR